MMDYTLRSQSAVEFLSAYAFVFLIVALALAILFFLIAIPSTAVASQCIFYSDFTCSDASLAILPAQGGSQLIILAEATQTGLFNISTFNAVINGQKSTHGYCTPKSSAQGQNIYCVANFTLIPAQSAFYSGTFSLKANYCSPSVVNLSAVICPTASNYTFSGTVRAQATNTSANTVNLYFIPINVVNTQTTATAFPFQQRIVFNPSNAVFQPQENVNLGNVKFYAYGRELDSWCETGCSNSINGNAVFWVKIPSAIPASSSVLVDMYFLPKFVAYDTFGGIAPQLTSPAGSADNGDEVFPYYYAFAGGNACNLNGLTGGGPPSIVVSSGSAGCTIGGATANNAFYLMFNNRYFTPPFIVDAGVNVLASGLTNFQEGMVVDSFFPSGIFYGYPITFNGNSPNGLSVSAINEYGAATPGLYVYSGANTVSFTPLAGMGTPTTEVESVYQAGYPTITFTGFKNNTITTNFQPQNIETYGYIGFLLYYQSGSIGNEESLYWIRSRTVPPSGVMPTATLGAPQTS